MTAEEEITARVRAEGLLGGEGSLVAMLSGGRDSVCLLDVAVAVRGAERVHALHVNYGLRPDADGDERHCVALCERLGVALEVTRAGEAGERGGNLHAWARELRYGAAQALAQRLDGEGAGEGEVPQVGGDEREMGSTPPPDGARQQTTRIATGHTSTDQVETILYRLAASPGRRALLGMAPRDGRLVRPLLGVTREQTAAYCRERNLPWREDASNDDPRYARARVRHGLLQALTAVHPAAGENVLRTAELLREEGDLLERLVQAELGGGDRISVERLRALHPALRRLVLIRLAEGAAGALVPQAGERAEELLALAARGGRAELHVGGLASAVLQDGTLRFVKIAPREQRPPRGGQ